mmetsp:Transcript_764/g.1843  ORF Transcript_764/g.1843 Transcript_764/m.1843 type:complete len:238 (+) Transcript_764:414-1127(+)
MDLPVRRDHEELVPIERKAEVILLAMAVRYVDLSDCAPFAASVIAKQSDPARQALKHDGGHALPVRIVVELRDRSCCQMRAMGNGQLGAPCFLARPASFLRSVALAVQNFARLRHQLEAGLEPGGTCQGPHGDALERKGCHTCLLLWRVGKLGDGAEAALCQGHHCLAACMGTAEDVPWLEERRPSHVQCRHCRCHEGGWVLGGRVLGTRRGNVTHSRNWRPALLHVGPLQCACKPA